MRNCFHILCSLLVLATYLWGGCTSCEQFFMIPGGAKHDCCKHGKCTETPQQSKSDVSQSSQPERECATMPFSHQQDAGSTLAAITADLPVYTVPATELFSLSESHWQLRADFDPLADSPPDLVVLTGSFLI